MVMRLDPPEGLMDADADDPISQRMRGETPARVPDDPVGQEPERGDWVPAGSEAEMEAAAGNRAPKIPLPPEGTVELPGGYIDEAGVLAQNARVRELTGQDEEALAPYNPEKNIAEYITQLVVRGTVSVGSAPMTLELSKKLLMGDRDALVLGIRKVTFGNEIPVQLRCVDCDIESDVFFDIDEDIPVRKLSDPNQRSYVVPLRHGKVAKVVLPNGEVHERVLASKLSIAEVNTLMLSMCVREIDGESMITSDSVRRLGIEDRRKLIDFMMETQPGPRMNLRAPCHRCGREYPVTLPIAALFR